MDTFGYWDALPIGLVQLAVLMIHKDAQRLPFGYLT